MTHRLRPRDPRRVIRPVFRELRWAWRDFCDLRDELSAAFGRQRRTRRLQRLFVRLASATIGPDFEIRPVPPAGQDPDHLSHELRARGLR